MKDTNSNFENFIARLGIISELTAKSLNGAVPSNFLRALASLSVEGKNRKKEAYELIIEKFSDSQEIEEIKTKLDELMDDVLSNEKIKKHPNYPKIIELINKAYQLFETLREVFIKYLSNIINDQNYSIQLGDSIISSPQFELDNETIKTCEKVEIENVLEGVKRMEFKTVVESQSQMFIDRIDAYQKLLDYYNSEIKYTVPQI